MAYFAIQSFTRLTLLPFWRQHLICQRWSCHNLICMQFQSP